MRLAKRSPAHARAYCNVKLLPPQLPADVSHPGPI